MDDLGRKGTLSTLHGTELAREVAKRLAEEYPGNERQLCALRHRNAYELLVATILSAQCTDERVNQVTPTVFSRYPDPASLAEANLEELEELIRPTGFYHAKAANLIGMASAVVERFAGRIPSSMEELVSLPGVGRKTANVVLGVAFGQPGLPVDTHVARVSQRIGLTTEKNPDKIEADLVAALPPQELASFSLRMILHGRKVCKARKPLCDQCVLFDVCSYAVQAAAHL